MALTPKQQRFVDEYMIDLNATQAAIRAGYSKKTAKSIGQENLTKPDISSAISFRQKELSKRNEVTVDSMAKQYDEDRAFAIQCDNPSAAVAASTGKARLFGLDRQKVEVTEVVVRRNFMGIGRDGD